MAVDPETLKNDAPIGATPSFRSPSQGAFQIGDVGVWDGTQFVPGTAGDAPPFAPGFVNGDIAVWDGALFQPEEGPPTFAPGYVNGDIALWDGSVFQPVEGPPTFTGVFAPGNVPVWDGAAFEPGSAGVGLTPVNGGFEITTSMTRPTSVAGTTIADWDIELPAGGVAPIGDMTQDPVTGIATINSAGVYQILMVFSITTNSTSAYNFRLVNNGIVDTAGAVIPGNAAATTVRVSYAITRHYSAADTVNLVVANNLSNLYTILQGSFTIIKIANTP